MKILESIQPRLAELGKIKIGGKGEERPTQSGGTFRIPQKHSYFTITGCERDSAGDLKVDSGLMDRLLLRYGEEVIEEKRKGTSSEKTTVRRLREIPIALLSDSLDDVIMAAYCYYEGRSLIARCDGETCTRFRDKDRNPIPGGKAAPCSGEHLKAVDKKGRLQFKLHTKLVCAIAEGEAKFGGYYVFRTTSLISTQQLVGGLRHVQSLTGGILCGLPLRLVVRGVEVQPEGKPTTVYVAHIELRGADLNAVQQQALALAQVRIKNAHELGVASQQYRALLTAPGENEETDEQAEVAAEYHPPDEAVKTTVIEAKTVKGSVLKVEDEADVASLPLPLPPTVATEEKPDEQPDAAPGEMKEIPF